jgi:hypothetical protein
VAGIAECVAEISEAWRSCASGLIEFENSPFEQLTWKKENEMEVKQTNQVNMFKAVLAYLNQNNSIWGSMAPFTAAVTSLNDGITGIDETAQNQETPTGDTQDKAEARDALEDVLFLTCQALSVLAHTESDNDLLALVSVTPSTLDKMDAEELSNRAAAVLAKAQAQQTSLAALHVTQTNVLELDTALQNFNATKTGPRTRAAERKAQTQSLAGKIRAVSGILRHQIDPMVNLFRRTNPDFVAGYRAARVIIDRPATRPTAAPTTPTPPTPTAPHTP